MLLVMPLLVYNYAVEMEFGLEYTSAPIPQYFSISERSLNQFPNVRNILDYYQAALSRDEDSYVDPTKYRIRLGCIPHSPCHPLGEIRMYQLQAFREAFGLEKDGRNSNGFSTLLEYHGNYYRIYVTLPKDNIIDYVLQGFVLTVLGTVAIALVWALYDKRKTNL
jgi:hypothetical protein